MFFFSDFWLFFYEAGVESGSATHFVNIKYYRLSGAVIVCYVLLLLEEAQVFVDVLHVLNHQLGVANIRLNETYL